jgi:hypothetical protein
MCLYFKALTDFDEVFHDVAKSDSYVTGIDSASPGVSSSSMLGRTTILAMTLISGYIAEVRNPYER